MTLTYSTIIADRSGRATYLRNQCAGFLNALNGKSIRTAGSRASADRKSGSDDGERRSFITVATVNHKVAAFIELRTIAGSQVFDDGLMLNAIDKSVWDSTRTVEIASLGVDTSTAAGSLNAAEVVADLMQRTTAYLWPLGIRRMVVQCRQEDRDLFALTDASVKKLLTDGDDERRWLGVRLNQRWAELRQEPSEELYTAA
ncbi:MAG: hypothetical protein AAFY73_03120 [Pseudomonadota bacterium]